MNRNLGCEKLGTSVMNSEDCLMFLDIAVKNGSNKKEAFQDLKFIDTCLEASRIHLLAFNSSNKTSAGRYRKGHSLYDMYDKVLDSRLTNDL